VVEETYYETVSEYINEEAERKNIYNKKVNQATQFANEPDSQSYNDWVALFFMGLTLAGLELLPIETGITPRPYWVRAPLPPLSDPDAWTVSWIIEVDAFHDGVKSNDS
jgi:hypothetical protein